MDLKRRGTRHEAYLSPTESSTARLVSPTAPQSGLGDVGKEALYGIDDTEAAELVTKAGQPGYRAKQLLEWIYKKHVSSFDEAKNLPSEFRNQLARQLDLFALRLGKIMPSSARGTAKYLFETRDGHFLETVVILAGDRRTVCVSTQLGCKIKCVFCASGRGRFARDLTPGEIIEQVAWAEKKLGKKITNVVFMGIGEPLDNFEATMKALKILQAPWGFGLGNRRITVSTAGVTPKIFEFVRRNEGRVRLSVSLHSSKEKTRAELVPLNKRYPLKDLTLALDQVYRTLKREITFEYTLIDGVNDSPDEAEGVARIAKPLKAKVNLIPCNPIEGVPYRMPSPEKIEAFREILQKRGIRTTVRRTEGSDIGAACGQLRLKR